MNNSHIPFRLEEFPETQYTNQAKAWFVFHNTVTEAGIDFPTGLRSIQVGVPTDKQGEGAVANIRLSNKLGQQYGFQVQKIASLPFEINNQDLLDENFNPYAIYVSPIRGDWQKENSLKVLEDKQVEWDYRIRILQFVTILLEKKIPFQTLFVKSEREGCGEVAKIVENIHVYHEEILKNGHFPKAKATATPITIKSYISEENILLLQSLKEDTIFISGDLPADEFIASFLRLTETLAAMFPNLTFACNNTSAGLKALEKFQQLCPVSKVLLIAPQWLIHGQNAYDIYINEVKKSSLFLDFTRKENGDFSISISSEFQEPEENLDPSISEKENI